MIRYATTMCWLIATGLRQNVADDSSVNVGQSKVSPLEGKHKSN
jgi:hypothetical protein